MRCHFCLSYDEMRRFPLRPRWSPSAILKEFLTRPTIFSTAPLRNRLESQARANLARAIEQLGG
jgi:predicted metal-dependent HD superfamily phosphohydrolase